MDLNTYLFFNGNCEAAFTFYEKALGGKILMMMRNADAPPDQPMDEKSRNLIMHARLRLGERHLMGSDTQPGHFKPPQGFRVQLEVATPEEAERVFHALAEGGTIAMPIAETFWARRFGMLQDRFGTPWMINCDKPMSTVKATKPKKKTTKT